MSSANHTVRGKDSLGETHSPCHPSLGVREQKGGDGSRGVRPFQEGRSQALASGGSSFHFRGGVLEQWLKLTPHTGSEPPGVPTVLLSSRNERRKTGRS